MTVVSGYARWFEGRRPEGGTEGREEHDSKVGQTNAGFEGCDGGQEKKTRTRQWLTDLPPGLVCRRDSYLDVD